MPPTKTGKIEKFAGLDIKLWFKNGKKLRLGDGLLISDGTDVHVWLGQRTDDQKKIVISEERIKETKVRSLFQATYRNLENGNFETFTF